MTLITEIEKSTLNFIWKHKQPQVAKAIFCKKSSARGITISNFKILYSHSNKNRMVLKQKTDMMTSGTE
jgi:hypothetical protein